MAADTNLISGARKASAARGVPSAVGAGQISKAISDGTVDIFDAKIAKDKKEDKKIKKEKERIEKAELKLRNQVDAASKASSLSIDEKAKMKLQLAEWQEGFSDKSPEEQQETLGKVEDYATEVKGSFHFVF